MGDCRRECATIAKICSDLIGDHDTDLSEMLVQQAGRAAISNALCHTLSPACAKPPPKFEGARPDGEEWLPVDEGQIKLQRMLAQMEGDGMSGDVRLPLPLPSS